MDSVITRFPPSPTGYLHVGGARTALFNWLYARHTGGRFVLRFEDTDVERSTQQSVEAILDSMAWLGIDWDEGPYYQSERLPVYQEHLRQLLDTEQAYYCTCSPEDIEAMRQEAMARGGKPRYDGRCRERRRPASDDAVIRFKAPLAGTTVVDDKVKGPIAFQNNELDDFIICRSDGMPMYNLAVVVDDITMGINTIIRGDDHVNNTPKQILLYKALGSSLPVFAHVPMVLGSDRARLSKRHGAMSVTEYREMGYLPDAMLNYLVRLGWSHGDQEFFTRQDLIDKFSLENIGKSAGIFDPAKLLALNAEHVRATEARQLVTPLRPFLKTHDVAVDDDQRLREIVETLQSRSKTLVEMAAGALFYFQSPVVYEEKAAAKFLKTTALEPLRHLTARLSELPAFEDDQIEGAFVQTMEATGLKLGKIAQPVRVALSGKTVSPGIFEIIRVLGREETLKRMDQALAFMQNRQSAQE
ncbi:MAG: glutamate--tRNA ligase [Desulfobacterales bacterium]|nr:glutamate--tRNA ligase [Desulfobacterales bacterium]